MEVWKPMPDFVGRYEVSNLGRVKRLAAVVPVYRASAGRHLEARLAEKIMKPWRGYVNLTYPNGIKTRRHIRRLVARTFP